MNDTGLWHFLKNVIENNGKVALSVVTDSSESSPGRQGFKMAFTDRGKQFGTIGGGVLEAKIIKLIQGGFESGKRSIVNVLHHDPKSGFEKSGLICGGTQTVVTYFLDKSEMNLIKQITDNFDRQKECVLIINQNGIFVTEAGLESKRYNFNIKNINEYEYREIYGITDTVYIVGGGHVGFAVSKIMSMLNFYVVVMDNRENVFTMEQNTYANRKVICKFEDAGKHIREGDLSYVVIVTPMHKSDKVALKSVIDKKLKYLGMMGSKRKIKTIFENLIAEGVEPAKLEKVHTPIGLEIEANTPEEIAVSIAAEIISVKNNSTSNTDKL